MGKLVKKIAAAVVVGALTAISGGTLTAALIAGGIALLQSTLLAPKVGRQEDRQASETTLSLGEGPREAVLGKAATGGSLLDGFNFGGEHGTDWEVLLIALADHECDALEGFFVRDSYVAFAGDGPVAGYNGQLEVYFLPGTASQAWPTIVTANGAGWNDPANNCAGVACVAVAYKADDPEAENPTWPGGRPSFLWVVRGKKCYDPGKDSTVPGGSGLHRWADPATWEWSDDPAVCRYQYQRGIYALDRVDQPDQLLIGRGLSEIEAPPEAVIAHSAVCNELVAVPGGGTRRRYTFNGIVAADESFLEIEGYFAAATGGVIRQPEGAIEVEPGAPKAAVVEITDEDILNLAQVEVEQFRGEADREWVNTVVARYVEPEQKWKMHAAPVKRVQADIVADGGQRLETPEFKAVTDGNQAQALAEIQRRLGRLLATAGITLGPRFAELEEGDWIGWTSARHFKGARKVFRVESYDRSEKWHMALRLREIAASVFADELPETPQAVATQQAPPAALVAPAANDWALAGGAVAGPNGTQPALFLTGAVGIASAERVRFDYRKTGESAWISAGEFARGTQETAITGLADTSEYEVAVSYLVDGEPTPRRILAPATTGALEGARGAQWIASRSVAYPLSSDDTSITIGAFTAVLFDGSSLSLPAGSVTGLASGTSFGVFYDPVAEAYSAEASPSSSGMANRALVFVGGQATSTSGTHPTYSAPPGSGGDGSHLTP